MIPIDLEAYTCLWCGAQSPASNIYGCKEHFSGDQYRAAGFPSGVPYPPPAGWIPPMFAPGLPKVTAPPSPRCECGAAKLGVPPHTAGHSKWCPVASK